MKYTPGPWFYGSENLKPSMFVAHQDGKQPEHTAFICEIPPNTEQAANAKLISAAPELLEALQLMVAQIDKGYLVLKTADGTADYSKSLGQDFARAAITKATL